MINIEFHTVRGYQIMEQNKKHLTSSMDDYVEMIYRSKIKEGRSWEHVNDFLLISRFVETYQQFLGFR